MKKRLFSFLIVLVLLLSISTTASAETAASDAKKSVAVVAEALQIDGQTTVFGMGTGFFIGKTGEAPKYLLTNHHVVADYLENGAGQLITITSDDVTHEIKTLLRVYFDSSNYIEAYVVDYDSAQDFAILRLETATTDRVPLKVAVPTEQVVGESMYSVGFPGISDNSILDPTSQWGMEDAMIARGTVGRLITTSGSGTRFIETTDITWNHGNSGGPVLHDGVAIGIVSGAVIQSNGVETESVHYAVNMEPVITLLQKNNVPFELAEEGFNFMKWLPYIIGAVVLVLVAILLTVLLKKRKKRIKKTDKNDGKTMPQQFAIVKSMAPQHNGARVLIKELPLTIGRSSSCAIVFAKDTPGVSGVHCSVSFEPSTGDFILTDLKSTYGTYLINGHKLTPNSGYRLRSGDSFYVGDPGNVLRVELEKK